MSSALWRGYIATFEIDNNQLYLKDIEVQYNASTEKNGFEMRHKSVLGEVFPDGKRLKIDWLSGLLVLPQGKIVNYVHMGYGSTYEKYTLIETNNGNIGRSRNFDAKGYETFKEKQFAQFKTTPEYKKAVDELKKDGDTDSKFIDSFLRSFITNYTSAFLVD